MNKEIQTKWDLRNIYKDNPEQEAEKDCKYLKSKYKAFASKYRKNKKHLKSPQELYLALVEYEKLTNDKKSDKPYLYYGYRKELNSSDNVATAKLSQLSEFYAELSNEIDFFTIEIGKIDKKLQEKFINSKELKDYKYFLKRLFINSKYFLSEQEEKVINLKVLPARSLWINGREKLLNKQTITYKGKETPISEIAGLIPSLPTIERREMYKKQRDAFAKVSDFAESEINAVVINKKIDDKLRGYTTPYEGTVISYENEIRTVNELIQAVSSNFGIAHKFFKIKAEMLQEKKLTYADRAAKIKKVHIQIPFNDAANKVIKSFGEVHEEFGEFVRHLFENGYVDVYPQKGKNGGAFCSTGTEMTPFVLLNHTNDFRSLTTLAHEMGHALHSKYSDSQKPIYKGHTYSSAEVASTFFENIVFENEIKNLGEEERMLLLHDKINDDISTIFRQVACFNFEVELHNEIRSKGFLEKEKIAEMMNKHMKSYLGPIFDMEMEDGYFFVNWPHIRNFFYVYSYAFGQLISDSLYKMYKTDNKNIQKVIKFLSAGRSETPENIFKSIGINPNKAFFEKGLMRIKDDIEELEKLWRKNKKNFVK